MIFQFVIEITSYVCIDKNDCGWVDLREWRLILLNDKRLLWLEIDDFFNKLWITYYHFKEYN
jgi:hypothetical protein